MLPNNLPPLNLAAQPLQQPNQNPGNNPEHVVGQAALAAGHIAAELMGEQPGTPKNQGIQIPASILNAPKKPKPQAG